MGSFSSLAAQQILPGNSRGPNLWRDIFKTDKESGGSGGTRSNSSPNPIPGGSYGRSLTSTEGSFKRLIQAMRSMAPGGWTDDRYSQSQHFIGIVYIAIHRIATMWQQAEFQVMQKDDSHPDGKRPVRKGHEAYKLIDLLEKPNPQDSFGKLMYRWAQQKYLTGTALTWMIPNIHGVPVELYSIPTAIAIPQPAVNPDYPDGYYRIQPLYPYGPFSSYPTPASAVGAAIPAEWMLRFLFPHPLLRYEGYSPLTGMRLHIDAVEMVDRSRHSTMRRTIHPSAVVNMKDMEGVQALPASEIERIVAEFEQAFMGPENQGHLMVAPPGGTIEPWSVSAEEMGYRDGWEQLTSFVLGGLGISKEIAGMSSATGYAQLYAALKQFYWQELDPGLEDVARDLTRHLGKFYGDDIIIDIKGRPINDWEINNAKISSGMAAKCITKNEVRKMMDMPVTLEEWGEEIAGSDPQAEAAAQQQGGGGMPGMEGAEQQGAEAAPGAEDEQSSGDAEFDELDAEFGGDEQDEQESGEAEESDPEFDALDAEFGGEGEEEDGMEEIEAERPSTGTLGQGSKGPRKSLQSRNQSFKIGMNGHSKKLPVKLKKLAKRR